MSIHIPCWSRPTPPNIALSGIRMHTICLIKCILFHIYLCRLYVIIRRHGVETSSTLLALCEGNHLRPMDSPRNRPLWRNFGGLSWTNAWKQNSPVVGDLRVMKLKKKIEKLKYYPMHIWNRPWPFIYEHHNRVPMLLSVTFDKIATLVSTFYWAHKFVAHWIRYDCVYFYLWPFRFVAVSVCGRFGKWPFRSVAVSVCGRFGLWPFRSVAVSVCGRLGFGRFGLWPLWAESGEFPAQMASNAENVSIWWRDHAADTLLKLSLMLWCRSNGLAGTITLTIHIVLDRYQDE